LRRDGARYAILAGLLAAHWQATYPGLAPEDYVAHQSRK
jgi:hypothetical protein